MLAEFALVIIPPVVPHLLSQGLNCNSNKKEKWETFYVMANHVRNRPDAAAAPPNQCNEITFAAITDGVIAKYEVVSVAVVGLVLIVKKNKLYVIAPLMKWNVVDGAIVIW